MFATRVKVGVVILPRWNWIWLPAHVTVATKEPCDVSTMIVAACNVHKKQLISAHAAGLIAVYILGHAGNEGHARRSMLIMTHERHMPQ
jgi:hypothetical protein